MRSLIILEVEHGEDTDALDSFAAFIADPGTDHEVTVKNYAVKVDLPAFFVLDS
jgi:hypothetical protein